MKNYVRVKNLCVPKNLRVRKKYAKPMRRRGGEVSILCFRSSLYSTSSVGLTTSGPKYRKKFFLKTFQTSDFIFGLSIKSYWGDPPPSATLLANFFNSAIRSRTGPPPFGETIGKIFYSAIRSPAGPTPSASLYKQAT